MDIQEVIEWTDEQVFGKTGKHLDSLQRTILEGTLENQTYKQVAEDFHCTKDHAKRVASELWKLLSDVLGENVKKSNVRAFIEKAKFSQISNFVSDYIHIGGNINFCNEPCPDRKAKKAPKNRSHSTTSSQKPEKRYDFTEAPEIIRVDNRSNELTTLKHWILHDKIRIVNLFGLPGMGKTALARELVEQIQDNFDCILWRNCSNILTLQCLKTQLIDFLSANGETQLPSVIDYLRSHSCLIILDELQELFADGQLAGTYLPECQDYGKFWEQIARSPHQSCFLLLTWETPTEIASLERENRHCRSLKLPGLGESALEILNSKGLTDTDKWGELIQIYGGNPSWLNIIASTIQDLFDGSVDRFLSYPSLFLGDLESKLQGYYQRLSESEKLVIRWLANQEASDIFQKPAELALSDAEFLKAVQSLKKRGLIEKVTGNGLSLFAVQVLFKAYLIGEQND
ncbi:ATP-binding protein [Phormidium pseudopriestleyi FRX01]|uniref:ATP-binding protein n=1 Tax=Phormidium pseudopriestleyi FRX01 TaxID=1759528 RepID=A0ABS3FP18_9CYAN|nr:NACHT domain-containing protein [Phormidium pseudopriestleyi]MBO0348861.1 ATP-binding protein [Phormidium pseudopriestleyi FRX01]